MKRLALVAALAGLAACTTLHPDRRTLTRWNMDLIRENVRSDSGKGVDRAASTVMGWIFVEPIAIVLLPVSWLGDTLVVNPIDGWKKAEMQTYERRFGKDYKKSNAQAALDGYALAPWFPPYPIGDILAIPEFAGHWIWNSVYPTAPTCPVEWSEYWNDHHEEINR